MSSSDKKTLVSAKKVSLLYYLLRAFQRWALALTVALTAVYWMVLISITVNMRFLAASNTKLSSANSQNLNDTIRIVLDSLTFAAFRWIVMAVALTGILSLFLNVRRHEKRMIADSAVIIIFCLVSVLLSQIIVRAYIQTINLR